MSDGYTLDAILFRLREEHFDAGRPKDAHNCAVCLALSDRGYPGAFVTGSTVSIPFGGKLYESKIPDAVQLMIRAFDERNDLALALVRARLPMDVQLVLEVVQGVGT